jgi:pyrroline-5-carboxylate reductase
MKITFVGGGNMASALIGGLLQQGVSPAALAVVEIGEQARARLESAFGVRTVAAADATVVGGADVVLLAVKPQQMREVALALAPLLAGQLVLTIAAGIRVDDLSRWLGGHRRIVRVMPNTPALIRRGVSGLYAPPGVSAAQREQAERILGAVGTTLWCEREEMLDAVTAISGSGPAYVFYFLEALERAGTGLGFDAAAAKALAYGTFAGAVGLAQASEEPPATLRARVTSKGGTTEAAIRTLDAAGVGDAIVAAARAAEARARELGDQFGRDG